MRHSHYVADPEAKSYWAVNDLLMGELLDVPAAQSPSSPSPTSPHSKGKEHGEGTSDQSLNVRCAGMVYYICILTSFLPVFAGGDHMVTQSLE